MRAPLSSTDAPATIQATRGAADTWAVKAPAYQEQLDSRVRKRCVGPTVACEPTTSTCGDVAVSRTFGASLADKRKGRTVDGAARVARFLNFERLERIGVGVAAGTFRSAVPAERNVH